MRHSGKGRLIPGSKPLDSRFYIYLLVFISVNYCLHRCFYLLAFVYMNFVHWFCIILCSSDYSEFV